MDNVFTSAWRLARKGAARFGNKPSLYFVCALRLVYADRAKAKAIASRPAIVRYAKLTVAKANHLGACVAFALRSTIGKRFAVMSHGLTSLISGLVYDLKAQYRTVTSALGMAYVGLDHCDEGDRPVWQGAVARLEEERSR